MTSTLAPWAVAGGSTVANSYVQFAATPWLPVVPAAELPAAARAMMLQMLANGPLALTACVDAVDRGLDLALDDGLALEAEHFGALAGTADMVEGTRAFLDKRPPQFTGT